MHIKTETKVCFRPNYNTVPNVCQTDHITIPGTGVADTHVVSALLLFFSVTVSLHIFMEEGSSDLGSSVLINSTRH